MLNLLSLLFLFIAPCDEQHGLALLEYGYIASNDELCVLIGWNGKERLAIKQQYHKAYAEISSKSSDIQEQMGISKAYSQSITYNKSEASRNAARGYILLRGVFAMTQPCVRRELAIDDSTIKIVDEILYLHSKEVLATINSKIDQASTIKLSDLKEIIDNSYKRSENEVLAKLKMKAPAAYSAYKVLISKLEVDQKEYHAELRRNTLNAVFSDKLRSGKIVYKKKISFPSSYTAIAYLSSEVQLGCTEQERNVLNEYYSKLIENYTDAVHMYNAIDPKTKEEDDSALRFISKSLSDICKKQDDILFTKLPGKEMRVKQLRLQLAGISHQFNSETGLFRDDAAITNDQRNKHAEKTMQRLSSMRTIGNGTGGSDRARKMFEMHYDINIDLYQFVLTAQQKEIWDKAIGSKLSKEEICELLVKLNSLGTSR